MQTLEMDSGEKRLNELGYKQELRREMVSFYNLKILENFKFDLYY